jgi:signal transduction histidine kinase/ActR/RegA family two-component response regulator
MASHSISLRRDLTRVMFLSSGAVLLLMTVAFCSYEFFSFRHTSISELQTLSEVIASNSTAALAFSNADDAVGVLSALRADTHVRTAALYDRSGRLFARYPAHGVAPPEHPPETGYRFESGALIGLTAVTLDGQRLGCLLVVSDLNAMYTRARVYGLMIALLAALSLGVAYLIARHFQRRLLRPILALADTARAVSAHHDYTVRVPLTGASEFDPFTETFNQMLAEIQGSEGRLRAQLARLGLLQNITSAIGERQDLESMFLVVLNTLEENLPIDFCCFLIHDPAAQSLRVQTIGRRSHAVSVGLALAIGAEVPIDLNGLSRAVGGELVYEPDVRHVSFPFPRRVSDTGLRSLVFAPLSVDNEVFGVLVCARRSEQAFSSGDCEFLKQLSGHVALASHQARLYSALQKAYDDLRQSQHTVMQQERLRALGQMASGIAHDINNAISPVALYTDSLLEREPGLSERARGYLVTIQRAIDDVARTVARMREFYREREAQMTLERVGLNRAVQQVVQLTKPRWSDQRQLGGVMIEVKCEFDESLPAIMGAEHEIRDALTNLIFNAVDAMPEGGRLVLRTRSESSEEATWVIVEVADSGVGMDEDTRRRCLEPFYTTKGERGTGLGLAMVYGMIQRHSAEIQIESTVRQGTTVRLLFCADTSSIVSPATSTAAQVIRRRLRILLIDDDPLIIKSLQDTLQQDGHVTVATHGGQAGIDAFTTALRGQEHFDLVITDLGMPNVDGRRVAAAIKTLSEATPIILLTGWGQRLIDNNDTPAHISKVLSKPPRLHELRAALAELAA